MKLRFALALSLAAGGLSLGAQAAPLVRTSEQQLASAIEQLRQGQTADALKNLELLTRAEPGFLLGKQIYGDLLALSAAAVAVPRISSQINDQASAEIQALADEAQMRLASEKAVPPEGAQPSAVLMLAPLFKNVIVVDLLRARLYVLENKNGAFSLLRHHYIGIGKNGYGKQVKGDQRTPVGVYHITGWKRDGELPELYGSGAFPLSYPNPWDVFKQRNGTGIWLHGVPHNVNSRPPRSSEGCVTMANSDLLALRPSVTLGLTPVILSDDVQWLTPEQSRNERESWLLRIESWRKHWSSRDTAAYLGDYSNDFSTEGMNFAAFSKHKYRVNAAKKFINLKLRDVNLFRYPGAGEPLVLAEFTLDYESDNFKTTSRKQQFWRQEKDGAWKIFREENH